MNTSETATIYLNNGNQLLESGNLEEAIAAYRNAIELNPDLSWSHHNLGEALAKLGKLEEAIVAYRSAIELNPDFSWSYHHLGDALDRQQQWQEAVVAFRRAIELNPEHFGSYCGLGQSLAKLGQLDEAIAAYRRASELDPETDWIQYKLGELLQQRTQLDLEGAIASYRRAIELNPDDVQAYRKLLQIQPDNFEVLLQLGKALVKLGQWEDAIVVAQKAVELNPDCETFQHNLDKVLAEQNFASEEERAEKVEDSLKLEKAPIEQKTIEEAIADWRRNGELNSQADNNSLLKSLEPISSFQISPEQLVIYSGQLVEKGNRKQLVSPTGNQGLVSYGPSINFPDGLYKIGLNFQFTEASLDKELENSDQVGFKLDVATEGLYVWEEINVYTQQDQLEFFIELVDAKKLEIRFWATGTAFAINWIELNLLYPPMYQDLATDYFFGLGKHLQLKGKQEHAGRLHTKVAELNPEGYLDKAIAHWRQARELEPTWITYFNLGMLLAQKQQVEEAFACYQKILEIQPKKIDVYSDLILRLAKQDITIFQKYSQKQLNEGEIYETIWQSLNQLGILNKKIFDLPTEISPEATYKYFSENSSYQIINLWSLTDEDINFLKQEGLSLTYLALIPKDDIELEEIYINSFTENHIVTLSRKENKHLRQNQGAYDIRKGRYFQHSIIETGYIYAICPITGKVLRSDQSFPFNAPYPGVNGSWHQIHIYRFVGVDVFYLVCAVMPIGDKSFIYFPRTELIINFVPAANCYANESTIVNMLKSSFVSYWRSVEFYLSATHKKEVAVDLGWLNHMGHFVWNEMSGFHYLIENDTLQKVDKFLIGPGDFIDYSDTFPEIELDKIIKVTDSWNLFKTVVDNNYVVVWPTDWVVKGDLGKRIYQGSVKRCSPNFLQEVEKAKNIFSPIVWMGIRGHYRVWSSQIEGIANIINSLYSEYPNLAVVFDGWGRHNHYNHQTELGINQVNQVIEAIKPLVVPNIKIYNINGSMNHERAIWANVIDFYITPHGSGMIFPVWVANKPGVVHGTVGSIEAQSKAEWTSHIRENAVNPVFLPRNANNEVHGIANYDTDWQNIYDQALKLLKTIKRE
jgi:tetratricopeptide (TPR) repeat protein